MTVHFTLTNNLPKQSNHFWKCWNKKLWMLVWCTYQWKKCLMNYL